MMNEEMAPMSYAAKVPYVINLSNGIIGVSILAMPFCMKQCGLLFGSLALIGTMVLTRLSCNLLMKGAYFGRSQTYESFALQTYGPLGKMAVEIFLILYTKGTLIAFFVIIGDLGPLILSDFIALPVSHGENGDGTRETIRILFMATVAIFIILPLSLLRSLGSLSRISSLAILFYGFLVVRIFVQSLPSLLSTEWWGQVNWWQPSGFVQTLPIFALSLSCQTQLFITAHELPDWTPMKMDSIVKSALHLCSGIYFMVGVFGYIAFHEQSIGGDLLVLLDNSGLTKFIKAGFLFSLAVSYPIMIFPCRSAIYSMVFRRKANSAAGEFGSDMHMPPMALKTITVYLLAFNLLIAIWIPDVELILALCGSLVGSLICFVMPGLLFYRVCPKKDTYSRMLAQICVAVGLFALIFSTYVSLRDAGAAGGHTKTADLKDAATSGFNSNAVRSEAMRLPEKQMEAKRAANFAPTPLRATDFDVQTEEHLIQRLRTRLVEKEKSDMQQNANLAVTSPEVTKHSEPLATPELVSAVTSAQQLPKLQASIVSRNITNLAAAAREV